MLRRLKTWARIVQAYEMGELHLYGHRCPLDLQGYTIVKKTFQGSDMPEQIIIHAHRKPRRLKIDGLAK